MVKAQQQAEWGSKAKAILCKWPTEGVANEFSIIPRRMPALTGKECVGTLIELDTIG